ncbi:MAG: c-type cytochrome [Planctomycetota bacterium]|nr:c-type cytochrome [Planctomycetaceae bacterium]MDQ3330678.1 c-type cytochrome [Planctomycetota bacterium]
MIVTAQAATEESDFSAELPRIAATEPEDALDTFAVVRPFRMELVAAEPIVADPVAMAFDENGRLYVAEMRDYSEQDREYLGVIRLLVDRDDDGVFHDSTIFAKELSWPTAVTCWDGGVFVGAPPHLFYLKDTDGDGVADLRKTIYTGFGRGNVQGMMNSLRWGLDNRIHGAGSTSGGSIVFTGDPDSKPVALGRHDFAFDPRTFDFEATTASAQHGLSFDDWGHKFICSNSDHIQQVMFEDKLIARNPYLKAPGGAVGIAADGPQGPVFRTSPVEPWRIVRTRLRVQGLAPGPIEFGGKVSGYFSSATGVTVSRGDAWPAEWNGAAIIGDVGSNLIHRKRLATNELPLVASRVDQNVDFITSTDTWFRPVQFENGPDGALYVADFYRETIEHPASLPESIKKHLDLTSGRDRGRIYRIVPEGFIHRPTPELGEATTAELVGYLTHPNAWHRESAARLLYERQDATALPLLKRLAKWNGASEFESSENGLVPPASNPSTTSAERHGGCSLLNAAPLARMHAIYALDGLGALTDEMLADALVDSSARVRENAIKLARSRAPRSADIRERLLSLASDQDRWVRYETAFSLGEIVHGKDVPPPDTRAAIEKLSVLLLGYVGDSDWTPIAALSSLSGREAEVLATYPDNPSPYWSDLAAIVARRGKPDELALVADRLEQILNSTMATATLDAWFAAPNAAVRKTLNSENHPKLRAAVANRLEGAKRTAVREDALLAARLGALQTLRLAPFSAAVKAFDALADGRQPPELQRAVVELLRQYDDPGVAARLIDAWPRLSPFVRETVATALTTTSANATGLLDAIEAEAFDAGALPQATRQLLREHPDEAIRERATTLLADTALAKRDDIITAYRPVLEMTGDVKNGQALFAKQCAVCHKLGGVGHEVGPNLAAIKTRGAEFILLNVLDPSREVNPQFVDYTLVTTDGVVKTGMIASESPTAVTLKRSEATTETVLRLDVEELHSTGRSLMPDGFEKQLDQQAMADLIAYLLSLE